MPWQLFIALRYLTLRRKEKFISVVSLISIIGVAIGVCALIIVIAVMSGFDEELKDKIIGTYSHLEVLSDQGVKPSADLTGKILSTAHVKAAAYFLNTQALMRSKDTVMGVVVKGIIPEDEVRVKRIAQYIKKGAIDTEGNGIVIGSELAARMGAGIGESVSLMIPSNPREIKPLDVIANKYMKEKDFKVSGIFTSGMYEYDMNIAYIDIARAQELAGVKDLASGAAVAIDDAFRASDIKSRLQVKLGPAYYVRTWFDSNRNFLEAIKLEKTVMFVILTLIVTVAALNIASVLIMTVLEKTGGIGILKAVGANSFSIMLIFALQGAIVGIIGTFLGLVMGVASCWCLKTYKFIILPKDIYYIDRLPVKMELQDLTVIVVCGILISFIMALYPAYRASRLDPVEALRYE